MDGPDVASGDGSKWVLVYFGGTPGSTTGQPYNGQTPTLPFEAKYHVRWSANNVYTNAETTSGLGWTNAGWDFTGDVKESGTYVEMRIPLADIGAPSKVQVHLCMINEASNNEWSYAAVPSTSFTDEFNRPYTKYFEFDLSGGTPPASYSPLP